MTISVSMKMTPKQAGRLYMEHEIALAKIQELEDKLKMAYLLDQTGSESTCDLDVYKGYEIWLEKLGDSIDGCVDAIKEFDSIEGDRCGN
jgi:hypothetical protein